VEWFRVGQRRRKPERDAARSASGQKEQESHARAPGRLEVSCGRAKWRHLLLSREAPSSDLGQTRVKFAIGYCSKFDIVFCTKLLQKVHAITLQKLSENTKKTKSTAQSTQFHRVPFLLPSHNAMHHQGEKAESFRWARNSQYLSDPAPQKATNGCLGALRAVRKRPALFCLLRVLLFALGGVLT